MIFSDKNKDTDRPEATGHHLGSAGEDGDEVINQLGNNCAQRYFELEECLAEYDRDWSKCQREVKALQECSKQEEKGAEQVSADKEN
jgi:cytochrome c oxidase assembly factor 4